MTPVERMRSARLAVIFENCMIVWLMRNGLLLARVLIGSGRGVGSDKVQEVERGSADENAEEGVEKYADADAHGRLLSGTRRCLYI